MPLPSRRHHRLRTICSYQGAIETAVGSPVEPHGLTIRIPVRRHPFWIGFIFQFFCIWIAGLALTLISQHDPAGDRPLPPPEFISFWLHLWNLCGVSGSIHLVWRMFVCEVIIVSPAVLRIRREVWGLGHTRRYDAALIRNLRFEKFPYNPVVYHGSWGFAGHPGGVIAFDSGSKTRRFGAGLDEAAVHTIIQTIADICPSLANSKLLQAA